MELPNQHIHGLGSLDTSLHSIGATTCPPKKKKERERERCLSKTRMKFKLWLLEKQFAK